MTSTQPNAAPKHHLAITGSKLSTSAVGAGHGHFTFAANRNSLRINCDISSRHPQKQWTDYGPIEENIPLSELMER